MPNAPTPPHSLLQFALRHMVVKTIGGSRQKMETGYLMQMRTVPDYNLIFVTRGKVVWVVGGVDHPLEPGGLVIVPPALDHHAYSVTPKVTLLSVHVEVHLPGGQDLFGVVTPPRQQVVVAGSRLDQYLRSTLSEYDRPSVEQMRQFLPHWSPLIVQELLCDNAARNLLTYQNQDPLVLGVLDELNQRLDKVTTLEELAAKSGFTAQHLNRLFRRALGVTPLQYLLRMRMEQAARLLRDDRQTVRAIARAVGFDDPYYFSRMFRQQFQQSPAQFRARLKAL